MLPKTVFAAAVLTTVCCLSTGSADILSDRRIEEENREHLTVTEVSLPPQASVAQTDGMPGLIFFEELLQRPYARNSDAVTALVILLGGDETLDYAHGVNYLKERGVISARSDALGGDAPLYKGIAAQLFCRALGLKGGIWLRLFPSSERYAVRELVFEDIMPDGSCREIVRSRELVYMFIAAAEYMDRIKSGAAR